MCTKSETYQKEGWFILEEENQVFGKDAEAIDNNINLESEDFYFYNHNKEEAKKNIDSSSKDLTDFIDSLIQDVTAPSDEDISAGIEKILKTTHPGENQLKTDKKKKVTYKVLFIAALLSILSLSCLFVVGSNHDISIENGFMSFAKETIQVVLFGEDMEEYVSVESLLTNLEENGYKDILFPQEFITKSDEYKVSIPKYLDTDLKQVSFQIHGENSVYSFVIYNYINIQQHFEYTNTDKMQTLNVNGVYLYVFYHNNFSTIEFINNNYRYYINSDINYYDMVSLAETIK